jgi:uncharacterized coiled-coil protein SlyX
MNDSQSELDRILKQIEITEQKLQKLIDLINNTTCERTKTELDEQIADQEQTLEDLNDDLEELLSIK